MSTASSREVQFISRLEADLQYFDFKVLKARQKIVDDTALGEV